MDPFAFVTAGESHGPALTVIVEGMPYGFELSRERIDRELVRRQAGYGRGGRMRIERDRVTIRAGVRHGLTLGSPIALAIENLDFANWSETMSPDRLAESSHRADSRELRRPRPGHADLAGCWKLGILDARPVLERASARETAARVAAGSVARALLEVVGVDVRSHVLAIGSVVSEREDVPWDEIVALPDDSAFRCVDVDLGEAMRREVDRASNAGDTLGGLVEIVAHTPPPGLGHYAQWHQRLDGRLGQALLSIPAVKAVWIGAAERGPARRGSETHDVIQASSSGVKRPTNRAGGVEGGMTNGEEVRVRIAVKPLSTLRQPLESIDLATGERADAAFERSDVTVVPAAGVVAEAMVALVLARAVREKLGGDSKEELCRNLDGYRAALARVANDQDG